ncbi:SAM-dependent methyltransferase [Dactylosporangium sp. NPDC050588]|uniref:SAM-dependent methyltransferase n=1 Tax=Dactylosporangium sp. NPDC050588 TaxID=3157211 RepID=UPI0033ECAD61
MLPDGPRTAARYDFLLGGKDHLHSDRASGEALAAAFPDIGTAVQELRRFMHRAVRYLVAEADVRQLVDVGVGIPKPPNVHDIAHQHAPDTRIVYLDHDPIVMAHARALLTPSAGCAPIDYLQADLRNPHSILTSPAIRSLDHNQPAGLLILAVLHFIPDDQHPADLVRALLDGLPPGSYVAISHTTFDPLPAELRAKLEALPPNQHGTFHARTSDEVGAIVDGLDLVPPGLVPISHWRPDLNTDGNNLAEPAKAAGYAVIARTPSATRHPTRSGGNTGPAQHSVQPLSIPQPQEVRLVGEMRTESRAGSVGVCQTPMVIEVDAIAVVRRHVDAFNARDLDALMAGFTEDALWITGTSIARGRGELAELFAGAMTGLLPTLVVQDLIADGDRAACQMTETLTVAGEERIFFIAGFYQLRDGHIASAKIYREGSAEVS